MKRILLINIIMIIFVTSVFSVDRIPSKIEYSLVTTNSTENSQIDLFSNTSYTNSSKIDITNWIHFITNYINEERQLVSIIILKNNYRFKWDEIASENIGKTVCIYFDEKLYNFALLESTIGQILIIPANEKSYYNKTNL